MAKFIHVKKNQLTTATWAGGTTTQLFIFPEGAEYTKFNFDFRISYATVEVPESTFTFMPGVTRHLMILKGMLNIDHTGRYQKQLNRFDIDVFDGEWPTKAKGKVTDFNLMTRGETTGQIESHLVPAAVSKSILPGKNFNYTGIYLFAGSMNVKAGPENLILNEGDFVLFTTETLEQIELNASSPCEIIVSRVKLNQGSATD